MAETSCGGWVRRAGRSSASTRPSASASGTCSTGSASTPSITRASASATESSAISAPLRQIDARLATALLHEVDVLDAHAALGRLHHVVDRETRDRDRGQRLHLDTGLAFELAGRANDQAGQPLVRYDVDF